LYGVSVATRHIIEAMEQTGTKRLVTLSSAGIGDSRGKLGFFREAILVPLFSKAQFRDKELQEEYVRESSVEWVIVRPTSRIARADVAAFMVDQLTSNEHLRQAPVIG
jgi:nucleoside-diphosphate-sugar epimerase